MTEKQLTDLKKWFDEYFNGFESNDADVNKNLLLKKQHTQRVCQEIIFLGTAIGLAQTDIRLAESMALFHDVGRFEQYIRFHTFLDLKSLNHAELAVKLLLKNNALQYLKADQKQLILTAIKLHNKKELPTDLLAKELLFSKLLRDADKLDIWRVVIDYYYRTEAETNGAIELGLPDTAHISAGAIENLLHEQIVEVEHIKNINDFKLLQIGWIYDINFLPAIKAAHERKYVDKIFGKLPDTTMVRQVAYKIQLYIDRILGQEKMVIK